jgi:DNA invertase Pin-like site-specific DNA recombinase
MIRNNAKPSETEQSIMVVHHGKYVAYYRVSTNKQGIDGYGIDAQRAAVRDRLDGGHWKLVASFTEVESGRRKSRPELIKALAACKRYGAKLIVAKLDRLARNARFLLTLIDSGVEVLFCDLPAIPGAMGRFVVTQMAAVAELEAGLVSERTKAGLAAAKRRGVKLGTYGRVLADANRKAALDRDAEIAPTLHDLKERGLSLRAIAKHLTRRKVAAPRGGRWSPATVMRVLRRSDSAA